MKDIDFGDDCIINFGRFSSISSKIVIQNWIISHWSNGTKVSIKELYRSIRLNHINEGFILVKCVLLTTYTCLTLNYRSQLMEHDTTEITFAQFQVLQNNPLRILKIWEFWLAVLLVWVKKYYSNFIQSEHFKHWSVLIGCFSSKIFLWP